MTVCSACGANVPSGSKFCVACGAATTLPPAPSAERAVSEALDPSAAPPAFKPPPKFAPRPSPSIGAPEQQAAAAFSPPPASAQLSKAGSGVPVWAWAVVGVTVLAAIAYGVGHLVSKPEEEQPTEAQTDAPTESQVLAEGPPAQAAEPAPSRGSETADEAPLPSAPAASPQGQGSAAPPTASPAPAAVPVAPPPALVQTPVQAPAAQSPSSMADAKPEQPPPQESRTFSPSFDCSKATTAVEKAICGNEQLSGLDRQLSDAYRTAAAAAVTASPGDVEVLRSEQRNWLRTRGQCRSVSCLVSAYQGQIDAYKRRTEQYLTAVRAASLPRPVEHSAQPAASIPNVAPQVGLQPSGSPPPAREEREPESAQGKFKVKFRDRFDNILAKRVYPTKDMADKAKALWDKEQVVLELDGSTRKPDKKGAECVIMGSC